MQQQQLFVMVGVAAAVAIGILLLVWKMWRRVPTGKALIVKKMGAEDRVAFGGGAMVFPFVNQAEVIDIAMRTLKVACRGAVCADEAKVDLDVTFYVRINQTVDDVIRVARSLGAARASDPHAIEELFLPKFTEAVLTVAAQIPLSEMNRKRDQFKDMIISVIGKDLNGFILDDAAIDRIEPAAYTAHDPDGRGRVERDGGDELERLRRDVDALRDQVAKLERALAGTV